MIKIVDNFGEHFDWNCIPFEKRGTPQKMSLFVRFNFNLGYIKTQFLFVGNSSWPWNL